MASRREDDVDLPEGRDESHVFSVGRRRRRDQVEVNELDIRIKVSYKTLSMIFVLFSLLNRLVGSLSDKDLTVVSEKLFGWIPF